MQVLSNITIDLTTPGLTPVLEGVQGDTARAVCLSLTENGKAWEIPQDARVLIRYRNENARGGIFDTLPEGAVAYKISGNQLTLTLPAQVLGVPGTTRVQAVLLQGEKQLTVFAFELLCQSGYPGLTKGEYTNVSTWLWDVANAKFWEKIPMMTQKYMFAGPAWNVNTFYPRKNFAFADTATDNMFCNHGYGSPSYDLAARLRECNVSFDFSGITRANYLFYGCNFTKLPAINLSACGKLQNTFGFSQALETIEHLQVSEKTLFIDAFQSCSSLKNLTVGGTIGQNGLDVSDCPLTVDSLRSILNALKSGVSGLTVTLGASNLAKLTDEEKAIAIDKGWQLQ